MLRPRSDDDLPSTVTSQGWSPPRRWTVTGRVTILLLGWAQLAAVMWCEPWLRWVAHVRLVWWGVAVMGLRAMTIYLWHLTSFALLAAVSLRLDGVGLRSSPTSQHWWLGRPGWVVALALMTACVGAVVGRLAFLAKCGVGGAERRCRRDGGPGLPPVGVRLHVVRAEEPDGTTQEASACAGRTARPASLGDHVGGRSRVGVVRPRRPSVPGPP